MTNKITESPNDRYNGRSHRADSDRVKRDDMAWELRHEDDALAGRAPQRRPAPRATQQWVRVAVPFKIKDEFKRVAGRAARWDINLRTWMIDMSLVTPHLTTQLHSIGVAVPPTSPVTENAFGPKLWMVIHSPDGNSKQHMLDADKVQGAYTWYMREGNLDGCNYLDTPMLDALEILFASADQVRMEHLFNQTEAKPKPGSRYGGGPVTSITGGDGTTTIDLSGFRLLREESANPYKTLITMLQLSEAVARDINN
jgi:hypothetical protein